MSLTQNRHDGLPLESSILSIAERILVFAWGVASLHLSAPLGCCPSCVGFLSVPWIHAAVHFLYGPWATFWPLLRMYSTSPLAVSSTSLFEGRSAPSFACSSASSLP